MRDLVSSRLPVERRERRSGRELRRRVLARYVSTSAGFHQPLTEQLRREYRSAYARYLSGWIPQVANGKWLDLACGQGALLELARSFGFETILGVDDSEEMVAICQAANLPVQQSEAVDFLTRSCPECWHVVSAFDLLEHLTRDEGFSLLCEVWRALSPGGVCLLKLPNGDSPWSVSVMSSDLTHETLYSPESLEQLSKLAGFARCDLREVGPICTGLLSTVRQVLWIGAKAVYRGLSLVETGSAGRGINTRNMLARLSK